MTPRKNDMKNGLKIFGEEECDYDFGLESDDGSKLERWVDGLPENQKVDDGVTTYSSKKRAVDSYSGVKNDAASDFARKRAAYHDSTKIRVVNIFTNSNRVVVDSTRNDELSVKLLPNLNLSLSPSKTFEVALARHKPSSNQCVNGNVDYVTTTPLVAQ
jgi:hypothetical protein